MRRCHRRRGGLQICCISFGIGLLACFLLPVKLVIAVLGIALVLCGLSDR